MIFRGIINFVKKNDSEVRLIIGFLPKREREIFSNDLNHLEEIFNRETIIDELVNQFEANDPLFEKNHLKLLAWMLLNNKIKIKLGLLIDDKGKFLNDPEKLKIEKGKLHKKIGIFYDKNQNSLCFCGSNNETPYGWEKNFEEFDIHYSWEGPLQGIPWLEERKKKFELYWENEENGLLTINLPSKCIRQLKSFSPNSFDEIGVENIIQFYKDLQNSDFHTALLRNNIAAMNLSNLWPHQRDALKFWQKKEYVALISMATGTGKTRVAVYGIGYLSKLNKNLVTVIVCPTNSVGNQWEEDVRHYIFEGMIQPKIHIVNCFNLSKRDRENNIDRFFRLFMLNKKKDNDNHCIIISSYQIASKITERLETWNQRIEEESVKFFMVYDEIHHLGAPEFRKSISEIYTYRMGLSATYERKFSKEETQIITKFLFNNVFSFSKDEAIEKEILSPYRLFPVYGELDSEEKFKYNEYTRKLGYLSSQNKGEQIDPALHEQYLATSQKRAEIVKEAKVKYAKFDKLIQNLNSEGKLKKCLIFCHFKQFDQIKSILKKNGIWFEQITFQESKAEERQKIFNNFESNNIQVIIAMNVLNEGIDLPDAKMAIMLSSSSDPREWIQRSGRILRRKSDKIAELYDFYVKNIENE